MFNVREYKSKLATDKYSFLFDFFSHCPPYIQSEIQEVTFKKDEIVMSSDERVQTVYFLLKGSMDAIEDKARELPYSFTQILPIDIIGDYEAIAGQTHALVSIQATKDCLCLSIPSNLYVDWLKQDSNASYLRMKILVTTLGYQTKLQRSYLSLKPKERFIQFLIDEYEKHSHTTTLTLDYHREYIASYIGCSVRTLNRTILELENKGLVSRHSGKIQIDQKQYSQLLAKNLEV